MRSRFRLFLKTFFVWLVTITAILLLNEIIIEHQSFKDVSGFLITTFGYLVILSLLIYYPTLGLLTRKYQQHYFKWYPVICAFLLNIPFFIFSNVMINTAFKATEALLFDCMFIIVGFYFGYAFTQIQRKRPIA